MAYEGKLQKLCKASNTARERNDCAVIAVAIACRTNYKTAHQLLKDNGRRTRCGAQMISILNAVKDAGYKLELKVNKDQAKGMTVNNTADKLQRGYYLVLTSGHILAVHNGKALDWTAGKRHKVLQIWKVTKAS